MRNLRRPAGQSLKQPSDMASTLRKTLEDLLTEEVVEGINRELDLLKSFPVYQAVPRAEVTGKVWCTRWCYRSKGPKKVRARFVVRHVERPEGLHEHNDTVWNLKRALNGLRDASRLFHDNFADVLTSRLGFTRSEAQPTYSWILRVTCSLQCSSII